MPMEDEDLKEIRRRKMMKMIKESREKGGKEGESEASGPVVVTDVSLSEVVHNHTLVVVDCWAVWCPPCRMLSPIIDELAKDYAGKILFGKLNVDENPRTAQEYGIMSIPTLLIFKNGELADRIIGAAPKNILEPQLTKHLQ